MGENHFLPRWMCGSLYSCLLLCVVTTASVHGQVSGNVDMPAMMQAPGSAVELDYRFEITAGQVGVLAIRFPWASPQAIVKAVEKNGSPLWLMNADAESPRESVATWFVDAASNRLIVRTYAGEIRPNDVIHVKLILQCRSSASRDTLGGFAGNSIQGMRPLKGNPILEVLP